MAGSTASDEENSPEMQRSSPPTRWTLRPSSDTVPQSALVAQWKEHLPPKQGVARSIRAGGINAARNFAEDNLHAGARPAPHGGGVVQPAAARREASVK